MAEPEHTRRVCLLADIDGYGALPPVAQSGLTLRLKSAIGAAIKSAGVESGETWRQDRLFRQLALLPVSADPATAVPLLVRSLLEELGRGQAGAADAPPLRVRAAITRDAVTRVKGAYAGRAVVTATRLLESPATRAELGADPAAVLALILSDGVYQDLLARGGGDFPVDAFRQVSVDVPEQGWMGTGWLRSCAPGALKPPPRRFGAMVRNNLLPLLAGGTDDIVTFLDGMAGTTGETGGEEAETAADHLGADHGGSDHDSAGHGSADHDSTGHDAYEAADLNAADTHYYIDETHTVSYDDNGYVEEYGTSSVYDGAEYDAHDAAVEGHDDIV
jgi:hypothetical protein